MIPPIPMAAPMATIIPSRLPFTIMSAPSQYPNGVMYFKKSATSEMFAIRFKKYIMAAIPSPTPALPLRKNAEMPKQMPASSSWSR